MLLFLGEAAEAAVLISFLLCLAAGKARGKNRKLDLCIHSYFWGLEETESFTR